MAAPSYPPPPERRRPTQPVPAELYPPGGVIPPGASIVRRAPWQRPRWWEWLEFRHLKCPAGHHLPNTYEIDEQSATRIRCSQHVAAAPGGCGLWVWATRLPGHGHLVIEVTERDLKQLAKLTTTSEKLDYLAIFEQLERVR